jgi:hypothetical protein
MTETVPFTTSPMPFVCEDGERYELVITGEVEITRGPLGRFVDLATQIQSEGLDVPPEIADVLEKLQLPLEG